ncbi:hypothetical protein RvY_07261 [Ramazzottius varieornatus]|uniref:Uncharacterized protein n=1 Tax=Ramazzottius varieornatus TaxID=947166 RepID=A0A1D1VAY1_RAMVA|nr:hypothetical protein RvY_07261 [Ramazzottius varieornatus]
MQLSNSGNTIDVADKMSRGVLFTYKSEDSSTSDDSSKSLEIITSSTNGVKIEGVGDPGNLKLIKTTMVVRKRGGNLSHLSESERNSRQDSDRADQMSCRSESLSLAISATDQNRSSRFKVVKLGDKIPYVRGRFTCFDFHDLPGKDGSRMHTPVLTQTSVELTKDKEVNTTPTATPVAGITVTPAVETAPEPNSGTALPTVQHNLHLTSTGASSPRAGLALPRTRSPAPPNSPANVTPNSPEVPSKFPMPANSTPPSPNYPTLLSYSADGSLKAVPTEAAQSDVNGHRRSLPVNESTSARASPTPTAGGTHSRKASDPLNPRPKGETYFAEMIDKVWEAPPGGGTPASSSPGTGLGKAEGFDRIEAKIQKCMSLVTEHVLMAVNSDLDQVMNQTRLLKERMVSLEYENNALRTENTLLRNAVMNPSGSNGTYSAIGDAMAPSRSRMK